MAAVPSWILLHIYKVEKNFFVLSRDITWSSDQTEICLYEWGILPKVTHYKHLISGVYRFCGNGDVAFIIDHMKWCEHVVRGHVTLWVESHHPKSHLPLYWCLWTFRKWRYDTFVFFTWHLIAWPEGDMTW